MASSCMESRFLKRHVSRKGSLGKRQEIREEGDKEE
jgi:hypothetical protein